MVRSTSFPVKTPTTSLVLENQLISLIWHIEPYTMVTKFAELSMKVSLSAAKQKSTTNSTGEMGKMLISGFCDILPSSEL